MLLCHNYILEMNLLPTVLQMEYACKIKHYYSVMIIKT